MTQNEKVMIFRDQRGVTTDLHDKNEKVIIFVTNAWSRLTFITQNEKVMIFRDQRGVTTDLLDA